MSRLSIQRVKLAAKQAFIDPVDAELDEAIQIDPYVTGTNSRRSDRELAKMLELIDNLPISTTGEEGQH